MSQESEFTFEDLCLDKRIIDCLRSRIRSTSELMELTAVEVMSIPGLDSSDVKRINSRLKECGLGGLQTGVKKGRPVGSKDKKPGSKARADAGRANAYKNGNGSHVDPRFVIKGVEMPLSGTQKYGAMWKRAQKGDYEDLDVDLAETMGMMYGFYKTILGKFVSRGYVDIPIYVLTPDGGILEDANGNQVVRALKVPKGELEVMLSLQKSLGLSGTDMLVTARSQDRRILSDRTALQEVADAKAELDRNRGRFLRKEKSAGGK